MSASGPPLTVAILAGGAATRLNGRDKGLEPLGGRPMIAHVLDAIDRMDAGICAAPAESTQVSSTLQSARLIVANRHLDAYSRYATTISDETPDYRGPLAGIAVALSACTTPWLVTVPVDCPDPPRDLSLRLLQTVLAERVDAAVAFDGVRRQPLFAIYRRELASSAAHALAEGKGVWAWQDEIAARELDFSDRRQQFQNLNTPEDFVTHAARDNA